MSEVSLKKWTFWAPQFSWGTNIND